MIALPRQTQLSNNHDGAKLYHLTALDKFAFPHDVGQKQKTFQPPMGKLTISMTRVSNVHHQRRDREGRIGLDLTGSMIAELVAATQSDQLVLSTAQRIRTTDRFSAAREKDGRLNKCDDCDQQSLTNEQLSQKLPILMDPDLPKENRGIAL